MSWFTSGEEECPHFFAEPQITPPPRPAPSPSFPLVLPPTLAWWIYCGQPTPDTKNLFRRTLPPPPLAPSWWMSVPAAWVSVAIRPVWLLRNPISALFSSGRDLLPSLTVRLWQRRLDGAELVMAFNISSR